MNFLEEIESALPKGAPLQKDREMRRVSGEARWKETSSVGPLILR